MAEQEALLAAIGDRLIEQLEQRATSETILRLAEAWAWVAAPEQAHGGFSAG